MSYLGAGANIVQNPIYDQINWDYPDLIGCPDVFETDGQFRLFAGENTKKNMISSMDELFYRPLISKLTYCGLFGVYNEGSYLPLGLPLLAPRRSKDIPYLWWCAKNHNNTKYTQETVAKIRVKLPALPCSLYEDTKVANQENWESRYWSIQTADGAIPFPVFDSIDGE